MKKASRFMEGDGAIGTNRTLQISVRDRFVRSEESELWR